MTRKSTDTVQEAGAAWRSAWEAAAAWGVDVSLIEDNLLKTPLDRIRNHGRALLVAEMLRIARKARHGRP